MLVEAVDVRVKGSRPITVNTETVLYLLLVWRGDDQRSPRAQNTDELAYKCRGVRYMLNDL